MIELKEAKEFDDLVLGFVGVVVVAFSAPWCGPCRMLEPILKIIPEKVASKNVVVVKINVDEFPELASEHNIQSVPTMLLFVDGEHVDSKAGFLSYSSLVQWIEQSNQA